MLKTRISKSLPVDSSAIEIFRQLRTCKIRGRPEELIARQNYLPDSIFGALNKKMFWDKMWVGFIHGISTRRAITKDEAFELIDAYERDPSVPENRNNLRIVLDALPGQYKGEYTPAEVRGLVVRAKFCLAANGYILCDREAGHPGLHRGSDKNGKRVRWRLKGSKKPSETDDE